jgi:hypothetical protein
VTAAVFIATIIGDISLMILFVRAGIHVAQTYIAPPITNFFAKPSMAWVFLFKFSYS